MKNLYKVTISKTSANLERFLVDRVIPEGLGSPEYVRGKANQLFDYMLTLGLQEESMSYMFRIHRLEDEIGELGSYFHDEGKERTDKELRNEINRLEGELNVRNLLRPTLNQWRKVEAIFTGNPLILPILKYLQNRVHLALLEDALEVNPLIEDLITAFFADYRFRVNVQVQPFFHEAPVEMGGSVSGH